MHLIVGLGNPGQRYSDTRHNIGFRVADLLADKTARDRWKTERDCDLVKAQPSSVEALILKPSTYMNRSGEAVSRVARFHKISPDHVIVIHDELDIPLGTIRLKLGGGDAGHNGLRSITQLLGSNNYYRIRVGIGRPSIPAMAVSDWVLGTFSKDEDLVVEPIIRKSVSVIETLLEAGLKKAQQLASLER
jgi:PTH1 family peptidyl-tRNA hydrolase